MATAPGSDGGRPPGEAAGEALVLEPGKLIGGKYLLERPAGFGGMAELWVAKNQATGAEVCVKILVRDRQSDRDDESVERFRREARAAAKLSHRAIIGVFDLLELDARGDLAKAGDARGYAIVMELLHGETLGDCLARRGKLGLEEALDLLLPVLSALAHAHRADVVHRDLKPDNVFLATDPDGHVTPKVLDFGVSKVSNASDITVDGVVVGTPSFMSPEQARGARHVDARSDVFSAGLLLYILLTGKNPFEDESFSDVVDAIVRREVAPVPELPPAVWEVLRRSLEKDPALRFADATEMGIALRKAAGRRATTDSDPMLLVAAPASRPSVGDAAEIARVSVTPLPSSASAVEAIRDAPRRRARAIALGVVGAAGALALAALAVTWVGRASDAERSAVGAPSASTRPGPTEPLQSAEAPPIADHAASAEGPSEAPSAPVAQSSASVSPPASASSSAPAPTATARAATPRRAPTAAPRRPGEEPNKARDPGF